MADQIDICNMALANLREKEIESLMEDSVQAEACLTFWDTARLTTLALHSWTFATEIDNLTLVDSTPLDGMKEFQLPSDHVRPIECVPSAGERLVEFTIRGTSLFTSRDVAYYRYVFDHDTPALWPPLFVEAVAWRLAAQIAIPITEKPEKRNQALSIFRAIIKEEAIPADGAGQVVTLNRESRWIQSRR